MSNLNLVKPIGEILQNAGLITSSQIEVALHDQTYYHDLRLGEILALRGWIEQDTVDFFVKEWFSLINQQENHPIGFYLKKASLLSEKQIQMILVEQNQTCLRFGATAVLKGFLKQDTIDFFLENLFPNRALSSSYITRHIEMSTATIDEHKITQEITQEDITHWVELCEQTITIG